ncbi:hypothetical protein M408DRAFT_93152 [Serendipita vermifera MAFF 305830]|uniref:ZW10 C-terminal helical domain-containing protein n=1 Tax=Serendipita vermifera MAFF 305830 TaxID=933852 RepID=A0A0C3BBS1_SERVB|nr:hypothetical protein M408DRAFT_93152 [Serendipita vermifera MAFF 305830]
MELAFELPEHLPRSPRSKNEQPQTSTAVLTALAEASPVTLADTTKWVNELDNAILETKKGIHDLIHQDYDAFQRQLDSSKSIQRRLATLTSNVNALGTELDNPDTGVLPVMLNALRHHSDLAQRSYEAQLTSASLQHLGQCRDKYKELMVLTEERNLPRAVTTTAELQKLLDSCPSPLNQTKVLLDLQNITRHTRDSVQEQLIKALAECISLTDSRFSIHPQYHSFSLHDAFVSVPTQVQSMTLTTIRKEIFAHYINRALKENIKLTQTSDFVLEAHPSSSPDCFSSLLNLFTFMHDRLLPSLPVIHQGSFAASFYNGLADVVQSELLVPAIPSHIEGISNYLKHIQAAINFELKVTGMGFLSGTEPRIKTWGDGAQGHYEKKRRAALVDRARLIILTDNRSPIRVTEEYTEEPIVEESPEMETPEEEVNWGFDDDDGPKATKDPGTTEQDATHDEPDKAEEGDGDGWGFDDDEPSGDADAQEESHDPWGVEWDDPPTEEAPPAPAESKPSLRSQPTAGGSSQKAANTQKPLPPKPAPESYLVSHAAKTVADLAAQILDEALVLSTSTIFEELHFPFTQSVVLLSTAPSTFDLFRAMYPVSHASKLAQSRSGRLQYSNDAKYLAEAAQKLRTKCDSSRFATIDGAGGRFDETAERLSVISTSWLDDTIEQESQRLIGIISSTNSFMDLAYDAEFTEAENAIKRVKNEIMFAAQDFALPLAPSICYTSLGTIVNQVIDQILKDVFAIRDISEIVSERLARLCRVLHPLDTLFPELENGVSTVASYVPLWLKFTYLSDILEGSIAEISSWWDAGHLVDYEPEELSRLIEALFADTPLRTVTISKIMRG